MFNRKIQLLSVLLILNIACKSSQPEVERGTSYEFRLGHPEIRISGLGILDQNDSAKIQIATEIVYTSLINKFKNKRRYSEISIDYSISEKITGYQKSSQKNITVESTPGKISGESFTIQEEFTAIPGEFEIAVTVNDLSSGKESSRKTTVFIPDPENPVVNLSTIQLLSKINSETESGFFPIATYDVPSRMDSLRFVFQVTNNKSKEPLTIRSRLLKFEADTSIARLMNHREYSASSIQYKGIDFGDYEIIESGTRFLSQEGSVYIEFTYPVFKRGNYRFEVETTDGNGKLIAKARDFAIKSPNYPEIKHVKEFAYPLYYIMDNKAFEKLIATNNEKELKSEIDRFWLSHIDNPKTARSVIELYYNRVEEANKLFSNYKEGWKTDLGMMYILFGPPWYENTNLNELSWAYAYNPNDPSKNFNFYTPRIKSEFYPFNNYILRRSNDYYTIYYQQVSLWLSGTILVRNL